MSDDSRGQGTTNIPGNPWGVDMYDKPCPHCGASPDVQLLTMRRHGQRICNHCKAKHYNGVPSLKLLERVAYEEYKKYVSNFEASRSNPLFTYSGWLHDNNIELIDNVVTTFRSNTSGTRS